MEDGIIRSKVLIDDEYTLDHAMEDGKAFRVFAEKLEGKKLLLVEPGNILKVSSKTRKYQVTEGPKIVDRMAIVVENLFARTIVSFFLGLSRMPIPIKIFSTFDEGVIWLKEE